MPSCVMVNSTVSLDIPLPGDDASVTCASPVTFSRAHCSSSAPTLLRSRRHGVPGSISAPAASSAIGSSSHSGVIVGSNGGVGAAVNEDHGPAEESGVGGKQEGKERGDLLGPPWALDRHGEDVGDAE